MSGRFRPYRTMFKVERECLEVPAEVACVNCGHLYPLADLLGGELNEELCGACGVGATLFYQNMPSRPLPPDDTGQWVLRAQ
jgi:hypothetical protein